MQRHTIAKTILKNKKYGWVTLPDLKMAISCSNESSVVLA